MLRDCGLSCNLASQEFNEGFLYFQRQLKVEEAAESLTSLMRPMPAIDAAVRSNLAASANSSRDGADAVFRGSAMEGSSHRHPRETPEFTERP